MSVYDSPFIDTYTKPPCCLISDFACIKNEMSDSLLACCH